MSANFFELQKFAATGIASEGMTYHDRLKAIALFPQSYPSTTIIGIPPLTFRANGQPLSAWSISGNSQQNGTPTPSTPIYPEFVGEIENIFEGNIEQGGYVAGSPYASNNRIRSDTMILIQPNVRYYMDFTGLADQFTIVQYTTDGTFSRDYGSYLNSGDSFVFSSAWKLKFVFRNSGNVNISPTDISNISFGRGFQIPITCGGTTTPVYLGQTQTTRRLKKLVLTGTEDWIYQSDYNRYLITISDVAQFVVRKAPMLCTHYQVIDDGRPISDVPNNSVYFNNQYLCITTTDQQSKTDFINYLAAQYAAGTPVCVWYVLATEQTGIVNEQLCKIGDYADTVASTNTGAPSIPTSKGANTLTVGTTVQPSSVTITT